MYTVLILISLLQVDDLMAIEERIDVEVRALETCAFKRDVFRTTLDQVIM